ncbi:MAG: hypothetical protein ACYTGN_16945 [Planctomycetota bacterium]|jgi:hypothetical protein
MTRTCTLLLALAAAVFAADERLTLHFANGKKKSVTLKGFTDEALQAEYGGKPLEVAWDELTAESAFKARRALTPYDDGAARLGLAEFAVDQQLFKEALEELEIALALGGLDEAAFEKREQEIQKLEVDFLCKRIDRLLKSGKEPRVCLAAIKRLKERYPEHANNQRYAPHVDRLVKLLAAELQKEQDAEANKKLSKELAALKKKIDRLMAKKVRALSKAEELMKESLPAIEKRQVARVKRTLVEPQGAEKYLKRARKYMREMAKIDKQFQLVKKAELQKEYDAIEKHLVECYLRVVRILFKERNYRGSVKYIRNILFYDPINEEALDMVEEMKKYRINFKASDITNARPRVTGG